MAKTWNNRGSNRNSSFSKKKREYAEYLDLESSGYLDKIANAKRIKNYTKDINNYDDGSDDYYLD